MAQNVTFNINLKVNGKDAVQKVTMNVDELRHVVDEAKGASDKLAASLINFNQKAERLRSISDSVSQLSSTLNTLTEESRSFGGAMAAANTMAGKSGEDFARLKDQVADLAKTVPLARNELANGLYQVISNGVPEDNWLDFLNKSARASVGGMADLSEVVKVTSTVIKNYGLDWADAQEIQDKIQLTAKNGVTSFEQLAQALPRVTSQASNLGVGIDELMASFATLTGVSGNTAEVSTQLAAIFTALIKPSSEATEMAQQMGIQFDAAAIKAAGGMQNFISQLDQTVKQYAASSGMLEQEIYGKLFGSAESLRALTPLTNQLADKFKENVAGMAGSVGTMDQAFGTMAATGSAKLQMLNNKLGEVTDVIQQMVGNALPYLNFGQQLLVSASSAAQLVVSLRSLGSTLTIVTTATKAMHTAKVGAVAIGRVLAAVMRGESVAATTAAVATRALSVAVKSLLVATGVGIAIAALGEAIGLLTSSSDKAAASATEMAEAEQQAADSVQSTYDGTLKQTYGDMMARYEQLKSEWKALRSEHEKRNWIKKNRAAFDELRIKISSVGDAEAAFEKNTQAVVDGFAKRAQAAAYAAKLTALYQRQIALLDKKNNTIKTIADDAKRGGRNAKEGDIIPESWRSERYGAVGQDGQWRFTKVGAERYNGTNTSGNKQVSILDNQIEQVNSLIDDTKKQMVQIGKQSEWITPTSTATTQKTNTPTTTTTHQATPDPLRGSIDYYEKQIAELRKQISATANEGAATAMQTELEQKEAELKQLKIRIGIEKPEPTEAKTALQQLQDQLQTAERDFDNATTIEAKVKAQAKVDALQQQIDQATYGHLTITANVEPQYIEQGSTADIRQSYQNAQSRAQRIQTDYEIGLIGKDEAQSQIDELNAQIAQLGNGLKPIKIDLDAKSFDKAMAGIRQGWGGIQGVGSGIESITQAMEGNKNAWERLSGAINGTLQVAEGIAAVVKLVDTLTASTEVETAATATNTATTAANTAVSATNTAAKSGEAVANATASGAKLPFPANIAAIAAGVAAVVAALGMISGAFATGGIVGGNSYVGDKLIARVNSGEMILNARQQAQLFAIANGTYGLSGNGEGTMAQANTQSLMELWQEPATTKKPRMDFRLRGRELIAAISNETKMSKRSKRRL